MNMPAAAPAPAEILARQRAAFLRDGAPGIAERKADLKRLRRTLIAWRPRIEAAVTATGRLDGRKVAVGVLVERDAPGVTARGHLLHDGTRAAELTWQDAPAQRLSAAGTDALAADPTLGLVTGWRSEIHPGASVYNQMCQVEWRRPAGPISACGACSRPSISCSRYLIFPSCTQRPICCWNSAIRCP